jgi:hypothetical protein
MSAGDIERPTGRTEKSRKSRVKAGALSPDEVRLLRAFRTMDDRARRQNLMMGIRSAKDNPRSEPVEPVIATDEALLLADFGLMDDVRKREIRMLAAYLAEHHPVTDRVDHPIVERSGLRLVVDNGSIRTIGGKREMTW